jgi:hypothetical protein
MDFRQAQRGRLYEKKEFVSETALKIKRNKAYDI